MVQDGEDDEEGELSSGADTPEVGSNHAAHPKQSVHLAGCHTTSRPPSAHHLSPTSPLPAVHGQLHNACRTVHCLAYVAV